MAVSAILKLKAKKARIQDGRALRQEFEIHEPLERP